MWTSMMYSPISATSVKPLTKEERIDHILVSGYLDKFSKENQDIIKSLLLEAYRA